MVSAVQSLGVGTTSAEAIFDGLGGKQRTEIGELPTDWSVSLLSDVAAKITDGEHITPIRSERGYYLLSARNILNSRIDLSDVDHVGPLEYRRIRQRCAPEPGDVLISCSGTVGRVAVVPVGLECVLVRSAALVKPDRNAADGRYIQYFLQSAAGQNQINASVNQGAQPNLFLNQIELIKIALPPSNQEQTAIAEALEDADTLIESLERLVIKKRAIKQGAMDDLLSGRRRLPGFDKQWKDVRLGQIAHIKTGGRNNQDKVADGDFPFFVRSAFVERIDTYSYDCEAVLVPGEGGIGSIFHYVKGRFDAHQRVYPTFSK